MRHEFPPRGQDDEARESEPLRKLVGRVKGPLSWALEGIFYYWFEGP